MEVKIVPAPEPLSKLIGIDSSKLSKAENTLLEAELLRRVCEELKNTFRERYKNYFLTMKFNLEMENAMLEAEFTKLIIKDILLSQEYTLDGIANYTNTPEDVICEVVDGRNSNPSIELFRKLIDLHRTIRIDIYEKIMKKITAEYMLKLQN